MQTPAPYELHSAAGAAVKTPSGANAGCVLLQDIVRAFVISPTSGDALETLFLLLKSRCGCTAMALEITSNSITRLQPYGDVSRLLEAVEMFPDGAGIFRLAIQYASNPLGRLLLSFSADVFPDRVKQNGDSAEETFLPDADMLQTIALLVGQRIIQEGAARRVEDAENRAEQRISEVAAIYEIGQAIDQIEHSRLLQLITERAASLMNAQTCSLMVLDEDMETLRVAASFGLSDAAAMQEQKIGEGIAGRVAQTEQPMLIVGDLRDPRLEGMTLRPEINSSMLVPMKNPEGRVLGVLAIRRRRPAQDFTDSDLKVFSVFATQAALALTNKQLYDNLDRRARELLKISTLTRALISTLNLEDLLRRVSDDICQVVGFDRCCLYLRESNRPLYFPRAWRGYPDITVKNPVRDGEGAVGMTARAKQVIQFNTNEPPPMDPDGDRSYRLRKGFARSLGVLAFVAVPILDSKNGCLGVVVADNRASRALISPEQLSLLSAFVNQAGIAIENARLYDTTQENLHNIHRLNSETDNVLQSIGTCILSTDVRGMVTRWNLATEKTLLQSGETLKGALLTEVIARLRLPDIERDTLLELVARVQESGESLYRAQWTLHPENRPPIVVNLRISRLLDYHKERAGVVLTFADVTRDVQMEGEMDRMRRLADIGQLAAKMAHEVRNALSPIKGAAQILRQEVETQSGSTEWPDIIISEVDGLSRLTSEMLNFARPQSLDLRPCVITDLLSNALQALAPFLQEHCVAARCEIAPDLPIITADVAQLGQVVRNIIMNAAQSMPDGGELTVAARHSFEMAMLVIEFSDTGIGIPDEDIERIFRPFVTTRTKGTGLGLPIVQKIVSQHGGRVEVVSELGKGTLFSVFLPLEASPLISDAAEMPLVASRSVGPFPDN